MKLPDSLSIDREAYRPRTTDEAGVHFLYDKLMHSWNHHDAVTFAQLFASSGLSIGFDGTQLVGQYEIETALRSIFRDHLTGRYISKVRDIKSISDDVMMLRAVAGLVPAGAYDINPELNAMQTLIALRDKADWVIVLFQNTPTRFHGRPEMVDELSKELRALIS